MQRVCLTLLLPVSLLADGARADPSTHYLRWTFGAPESAARLRRDVYRDERTRICLPQSVSWVDASDRVRWTRLLPGRMQDDHYVLCVACDRPEMPCTDTLEEYRRNPRSRPAFAGWTLETNVALVVGDRTGVLALASDDGRVLLDWAEPVGPLPARDGPLPPEDTFWADLAHYRVEGGAACEGDARGASIFARCGNQLLWFAGRTAAFIDLDTWKVVATGAFAPATARRMGAHINTRISIGARTLVLEGIIYKR